MSIVAIQIEAKSSTFKISDMYWKECPFIQGQISLQTAFVCPIWTFIFVDHNVMLSPIHVMALKAYCTREDLFPDFQILISANSFLPFSDLAF